MSPQAFAEEEVQILPPRPISSSNLSLHFWFTLRFNQARTVRTTGVLRTLVALTASGLPSVATVDTQSKLARDEPLTPRKVSGVFFCLFHTQRLPSRLRTVLPALTPNSGGTRSQGLFVTHGRCHPMPVLHRARQSQAHEGEGWWAVVSLC